MYAMLFQAGAFLEEGRASQAGELITRERAYADLMFIILRLSKEIPNLSSLRGSAVVTSNSGTVLDFQGGTQR